MKTIKLILPLFLLVLAVGCQTSRSQRIVYDTTDVLGQSVDTAMTLFADAMSQRALAALGPSATPEAVAAWIEASPSGQKATAIHARYQQAYRAWVASNKALGSGDRVTQLDLGKVFAAARELFALVGEFVPSVKTWGDKL